MGRRPTRTPKPSIQSLGRCSRLISPSPYLDRSFHRKKLSFLEKKPNNESENESSFEPLEPLKYDDSAEDSDYDINDDLIFNQDIDDNEEKKECSNQRRGTTKDLIDEIENLSIRSNKKKQKKSAPKKKKKKKKKKK